MIDWSAQEIAERIRSGACSARQVTAAFIQRIEEVNPRLNALVIERFAKACEEAAAADERQQAGLPLGPLHGVPMTVKECFHLAGTPATLGLPSRQTMLSEHDGLLIARLKTAGAIILGKTNVPQLMLWHEADNPLYGRTNNPWNLERTCGGSTGGEAALIAARGSPLGLGNDLGGSIRIPAHFCGIHGFKPTSRRLPPGSAVANFRGLLAMQSQAGPLGRSVADLELALRLLVADSGETTEFVAETPPVPWRESTDVSLAGLRIGFWEEDGYFPASPAMKRVVREAATALQDAGAEVVAIVPPRLTELVELYLALMVADGGVDARRLAAGNRLDWRLSRILLLERLPDWLRSLLGSGLSLVGQPTMAKLLAAGKPLSAAGEWEVAYRALTETRAVLRWLQREKIAALLCPPHALPAIPHTWPIDLLAAASYAFVPNLLGFPAGVVSLSRVRSGEENSRPVSRDQAAQRARETDLGSVGLPVGVQVIAGPWREDIALAVMRALEQAFRTREDYPLRQRVP